MKKELEIKKVEKLVVDVTFPMYICPNDYTCCALLNESTLLEVSIIEKVIWNKEEPQQFNVWINHMAQKSSVDNKLEGFYAHGWKQISPEEFDAYYFRAKRILSNTFNLLNDGPLPE